MSTRSGISDSENIGNVYLFAVGIFNEFSVRVSDYIVGHDDNAPACGSVFTAYDAIGQKKRRIRSLVEICQIYQIALLISPTTLPTTDISRPIMGAYFSFSA